MLNDLNGWIKRNKKNWNRSQKIKMYEEMKQGILILERDLKKKEGVQNVSC